MTMTANKNTSVNSRAGGSKVPQDTLDRCQSATPPPLLSPQRSSAYPLSDSEDSPFHFSVHVYDTHPPLIFSDDICKKLLNSISDSPYHFSIWCLMLAQLLKVSVSTI
uniref:Uncharacterized protein n=1 Tax=Malurus cyaneus samueli TaxID=2593467 RepID=A0A8C5TSL6_9PASS